MKWIVLLVLTSCSCAPAAELPLPPPEPPPVPAAVAPPVKPPAAAAAAVVKRFDAARVKELDVVTAPPDTVTPSQLQEIHAADRGARAALYRLGLQGKHASAAALHTADQMVSRLHQALTNVLSSIGDPP